MKNKLLFLFTLIATLSCSTDPLDEREEEVSVSSPTLPDVPYNYSNVVLPDHFLGEVAEIDNTPINNMVTDAGATLGRVLFYDNLLSANNSIACASCHVQANGFSDARRLSLGFEGGETGRNSMGLANARFYNNGRFFWDERAESLEDQVLMPIQDDVEMGLTLDEMVFKIESTAYYPALFQEAFGTEEVTSERVSRALAQFIRSMDSYQSRYDEGLAAANGDELQEFSNFSELENLGKNLFFSARTQCSNCHETATFSGDRARNNGLDQGFPDLGLGAVTGDTRDNGKFKVNSLRNIALTGPYMHDGRFRTIREVIGFYDNGIRDNPNLDQRLRLPDGQVRRMNLNPNEVEALVAFLGTLTDQSFINDERFSDPFLDR